MLRIAFVNQHYFPDVASTGQQLTDLAEYLARAGLDVTVFTATPGPSGAERRNGVHIRRLPATAFGKRTNIGRIADYGSFYARTAAALTTERFDGVVFLTTPPLLGFAGVFGRSLRKQRYGIWSMDLHPEAEVAAGMLPVDSPVSRVLRAIMGATYRNADFVVDLGRFMRERILAYGVEEHRLRTIHVWSSREDVEPLAHDLNPLREKLGLNGRFVLMYSGNAGIAHEFGPVLEAMERLRDDPRIFFLFVGDGARRREIEAFARARDVKNYRYVDFFPRSELKYSLTVADAHLVTLRPEFSGIAVPSKLYSSMATARPILVVGPRGCEVAETVEASACGAVVPSDAPDASEQVVDTLGRWAASDALCDELGRRGRSAFLERFEREPNCRAFLELLRGTWGARTQ